MRTRQLTRLVQDKGYTVKDMAKLFGVCEKTWRNWTSHPEQYLTIGRIRILAEALNLSEWEIFQAVRRRK